MSSGPINPSEVQDKKSSLIPDAVFESFNELIAENIDVNGYGATIKQDLAISRILSKDSNLTRDIIFKRKMLDVENIYKNHGWSVEYDKPGYNENYEPFFVFKPKK